MTETISFPTGPPSADLPPPGPPPGGPPPGSSRRLERDPDDAVLAGVCAAVGRSTDTDPVLWRVAVAVLALFGGAGVVLYALGWLLVPRRGEQRSALERTLRRPDGRVAAGGVVLAVVVAVVLLGVTGDGPGLGVLLVLGVLGYLVVRERREPAQWSYGAAPVAGQTPPPAYVSVPTPAYGAAPAPAAEPAPAVSPTSTAPPSWPPPGPGQVPWPAPVPRQRRPRSRLGPVTLSAATLLVGLLLALRLAGADGVTAPRVVATALLVVGLGLLVGTWIGRARWLLAVGALLALLLGGTAAAQGTGIDDGLGERTWTPTGDRTYRLGAGQAVLDLRQLTERPADVDARVAVGSLVVLVPDDVRLQVVGRVGLGAVSSTGVDGVVTDHGSGDDTDLRTAFVLGDPGDPTAGRVDLEVGLGEIEVRRVAA